jgi:MFS transporter, DHA1 family, multidrug resistance protein
MGNVLINIGWNASFAFLPLMVQAMGVERHLELWVGAMMFGYYGVSCMFTPVWGVLADYYGRKSMVLRAGFGMTVGFALLSTMSDPLAFLFVLILTGLANGFVPASQALVATTTPRNHIGGALALTQAGASAGTLLGPLAGAALIGVLPNMHTLFSFTAAAMFAAGLLAFAIVREDHVRPAHPLRIDLRADIKRLLIVPELKLLYYLQVLFAFTVFGAAAIVSMFTMQLLSDHPDYAGFRVETWVAITAMGFTLASIAVLPLWGRVLNHYEPGRVLGVLLAGTCVTSVLLPLVRDPLELAVARVLFALFVSGLPPALIRMIRDRAPHGMEARTLSYGTAIQQMGSATAPLIAGILAPYVGLRGFFWLASCLIMLGWILWLRRSRRAASSAKN